MLKIAQYEYAVLEADVVPGSGYVTPEGHIDPTWLICVVCDHAEEVRYDDHG